MKHNVFLGSGSGSIGDVVSYRREGTQVSRMRIREVKNPRTYNQAEQRNFLAPVSKFYAPLANALEQSFEGKTTAKSYAAFSSEAVKKARTNGWYLPKGTQFYPLPYQLSQGTIQPLGPAGFDEGGALEITIGVARPADATGATLGAFSKWLIAAGYKAGDQITVILVGEPGNGVFIPSHTRFYLDEESTVSLESVCRIVLAEELAGSKNMKLNIPDNHCAAAIIVSRYENEKWRRSTQSLIVMDGIIEAVTGDEAKENAIASYMNGQYVPVSEIYLNGSATGQQ